MPCHSFRDDRTVRQSDRSLILWMDGWMDGRMDGWTYGWMDGWMGGWLDGWNVGWTDRRTDGHVTDLSFFDAGVDGVQQVGPVLVALGEFSQLLPDQLPLVVAHHALERRVHVLGRNQGRC